jgi:hypothetical protein
MKKLLAILLLYLLASCHGRTSAHVPDGIIPPDSMVAILTDVHLLQASIQLGYFQDDTITTVQKAFKDLWKKHHVNEDDYNKSIKYYSYHPILLDPVYEKVMSNLNEQKVELLGKKHT